VALPTLTSFCVLNETPQRERRSVRLLEDPNGDAACALS
jgi:hypothetical protein